MEWLCRHYKTKQPVKVEMDENQRWQVTPVSAEVELEIGPGDRELILAPGLMDMQINGYCGVDFNQPDQLSLEKIFSVVAAQRALGVAYFLPTITTGSFERMSRSLALIAEAMEDDNWGQSMPGIHMEGPYISAEDGPRGAHPREEARPPDWEEFLRLQEAARGNIRLVTLSPEYPEALDFIANLVKSDVIPAIGHTNATPEQIRQAVDAGAVMSTHLGNGSHAMVPRHPNYIWTQMSEDRLWAGLIADGFHLPPDVFKAMVRSKGEHRVVLVSDAVSVAGLPPGHYRTLGMEVELQAEGVVRLSGTPYLAGSALTLLRAVTNAQEMGEIPFAVAVDMASYHPQRLLAEHGGKTVGLESAGTFTVLERAADQTLKVELLVMGHRRVYQAEQSQ
ncbi:MAG: amidohydrolase family protein [Firmicutes bacterium]|nr:amidohydrolase family protein [Bacillota bacterium]